MAIAQIPGGDSTAKHQTIIFLGILDEPRILFRKKKLVFGDVTVSPGIFDGSRTELRKLLDNLILTRRGQPKARRVTVRLRVLAEMIEAGITITGATRAFGIHFL